MSVRGIRSCGVAGAWVLTALGSVCGAQVLPTSADTASFQSGVAEPPGAPGAKDSPTPPATDEPEVREAAPLGYGPHVPTPMASTQPPRAEIESKPLGRSEPVPTKRARSGDETKALKAESAKRGAGGVLWPLAGVLALVVIAGTGLRMLARRTGGLGGALGAGGRSPAGLLEILGRYPVGRGTMLVLLKLDRRVLLLSQSAGGRLGAGFATLCEITDPEDVASILVKTRDAEGDSMAERFRSLLTRFDGDMSGADGAPDGTSSRRVVGSAAGDRAELWDERRAEIPVVDLTLSPEAGGSVSLLKKRLASLGGRAAP